MQRDVQASVVVNRPIEEVFAFIVDTSSAPRWQAELVEVKNASENPIRMGTRMTVVLRFLGRHVENIMQVSEHEPPHTFSLVTSSGYLPSNLDFLLEPAPGGTKVTYRSDWELPRGILFRLVKPAKPVFDRMDQKTWQANLEKLKELLETQAPAGT